MTSKVTGDPAESLTLMTFPGQGFIASVIAKGGEVELYSVLSCSRDFRPTLTEPLTGQKVTLQMDRLDDVSYFQMAGDGQVQIAANSQGGTNVSEQRWVFYGINATCGGYRLPAPLDANPWDPTSVPKHIRDEISHQKMPLNFYTEIAGDFDSCNFVDPTHPVGPSQPTSPDGSISSPCLDGKDAHRIKVLPTLALFDVPPTFYSSVWPRPSATEAGSK
ncbi:hypothetical protein J2S90_001747 [Arthrobacter bambusae]|uniref:Ricin B lectin domain-containing protein n=2 Tax=Arthrobacter bambusae TaxID=1338426 RepID=A0AAW8D930_9MICC|nr:hypothetical protein [Arthrobacter bambusae]MDP9904792.1 hypothetical protein [Arthrobacter bambusae]MDQ0129608.1 hypothetical protein [Arthrobacter bambusae]MDQ0180779.1 hypothetical protein [Arthrobacter bambusae]